MHASPQAAIDSLSLSVQSEFVPFSQSRNKDEKDENGNPRRSLNWRVTLQRNGREILTTDYSAGIAHCPGYAAKAAPATFQPHQYRNASGKPYAGTTSIFRYATAAETLIQYRESIAAAECESGFHMEIDQFGRGSENTFKRKAKAAAILPDPVDVVWSLVMDSSVLDESSFEDWANSLGYDTDSRKAESIYRACLEIALKLRNGIGESGLETLRAAFQDY